MSMISNGEQVVQELREIRRRVDRLYWIVAALVGAVLGTTGVDLAGALVP